MFLKIKSEDKIAATATTENPKPIRIASFSALSAIKFN